MGDFNVKVESDNTRMESVIGVHGGGMNDNGERLTSVPSTDW